MLISQRKILRRILRYIFFVSSVLWILVGIYIGYQYIWSSSKEVIAKGGTFVEWIFKTTSFLPYLDNDVSSRFYQGLLFNSCIQYSNTGNTETLQEDVCNVSTTDNQTYEISLAKWIIRSDGTPVSIEDVFFTYENIIHQNKRKIKWLETYKNLKVEKEANKLKVTFPTISIDNKIFFTNYILPRHILENTELQEYIGNFSIEPIYTNCANIVSQTTDQYSLIFNLVNCKDTNLNFYQIKNIQSFPEFEAAINDGKWSIVDAYIHPTLLEGYVTKKLMTNKLVTMFFNVNSTKLRVRTRRALAWFIKAQIYTNDFENYLNKYNDQIFNQFLTDGTNVEDFLKRGYGEENITKEDLIDIWVKELPKTLTVNGKDTKYVFYVENPWDTQLEITLDKSYEKAHIDYKGKIYSDSKYTSEAHKITYPIGDTLNNFLSGINKYKIYGYENGKKLFIGSVDVYNMVPKNSTEEAPIDQIKIIYYNDPLYEFVANNLQEIFSGHKVAQYFSFQKVNSVEELEGKITIWDYDIVINTIDMGFKKDFTNLFITDNFQVNPSQYQNQNMADVLKQYVNSDNASTKTKLTTQINEMYAKDMPLLFLGKLFLPIHIKENIANKIFWSGAQNTQLYEHDRRKIIYNTIHLANNINIDQDKVRDRNNFKNFIEKTFTTTNTWVATWF